MFLEREGGTQCREEERKTEKKRKKEKFCLEVGKAMQGGGTQGECRMRERGEKSLEGSNKNVVKTITTALVLLWMLRWSWDGVNKPVNTKVQL